MTSSSGGTSVIQFLLLLWRAVALFTGLSGGFLTCARPSLITRLRVEERRHAAAHRLCPRDQRSRKRPPDLLRIRRRHRRGAVLFGNAPRHAQPSEPG